MAGEYWAIDEGYLSQLTESLALMAENGRAPEALTTSSYATSKLQVIGDTAIIPITGIIRARPDFWTKYYGGTACEDFRRDFESVIGNAQIKQIILVCDSPGGSVLQVEETARLVYESRSIKPITAVTIGLNASACYWISSAAGKSIAGPSTQTGSVGVKTMHVDESEFWSSMGIKHTDIQFGKHKTDGSRTRPLDKQGRATLQEAVDSYGEMFVEAVGKHRNTSPSGVIEKFGGGKSFVASEALKRNMIDAVGSIRLSQSTSPEQIVAESATVPQSSQSSILPGIVKTVATTEETKVTKLNALMFGMGLLAALDASLETTTAALNSFCVARGESMPVDSEGAIDEEAAIAILKGTPAAVATPAPAAAAAAPAAPTPAAAATAAQAARDQEVAEAVAASEERRENIEAIALLINQTGNGVEVVSRELINAAIKDRSKTTDQIRTEWQTKIGAGDDGGALIIGGRLTPGQSSDEKFAEAASLSLLSRSNRVTLSSEQQSTLRQYRQDIGFMSMLQMAKHSLQIAGDTIATGRRDEDIASKAIQGENPAGRQSFGYDASSGSPGPAYNRPGDFANILSNLAGLTLDSAMELSRTTYQRWTQRLPDATDFKASTFVAIGSFTMLDDLKDGEEFKELSQSEEYRNYVAVNRHGNTVKFTPRMILDDNLDAFMQLLMSLGYAHDNTINEMFLNLLNANPTLPDGKRLFDPTRKNLIPVGQGGKPSKEQAELMKLAHYAQTGIDTEMNIQTEPTCALVPSLQETPAEQTYLPFGSLPEMKEANVDGELNVHRGKLRDGIVRETNLDRYDKLSWYTLDMMIRVFGHQFMAGYGPGGRRNTWFNNHDECRHYSLTGIFGGAIFNPRGIVKNPGQ